MSSYDLRIAGGTVIDGTGRPGSVADVFIKDGRIAEIGSIDARAHEVIDASGLVVSPGFIDCHTHYDAQVLWDSMLSPSPWFGVTTVVIGNCGYGIAPAAAANRRLVMEMLSYVEDISEDALNNGLGPSWQFERFADFLDAIETKGTAINVAALVPHSCIRFAVMGKDANHRLATGDELAQMQTVLRDALAAGALGLSSSRLQSHTVDSVTPVPSRFSTHEELIGFARVLADSEHRVFQTAGFGERRLDGSEHVMTLDISPDDAPKFLDARLDELREFAQASGGTVVWLGIIEGTWDLLGGWRGLQAKFRDFAERGISVVPMVACHPMTYEYTFKHPYLFAAMPAMQGIGSANIDVRLAAYADPEFRAALRANLARRYPDGVWDRTWVAYYSLEPEIEQMLVGDLARRRGVDPLDLALDMAVSSKLEARFRFAWANHQEDIVQNYLVDPIAVLGLSDAGAHLEQICDGYFGCHLLSRWVRERRALSLETAVWMLTARVAEVFGIRDRGILAPGKAADLVVFDPATIGTRDPKRVRDLPGGTVRLLRDATGISTVVVNGRIIRRDSKDAVAPGGPLPGRLLRHGQAAPQT